MYFNLLPFAILKGLLVFIFLILSAQAVQAERYYPVDHGRLTSERGWRIDPFGSGKYRFHHGWDIACPEGTPVYPTQRGVVLLAEHYKGYGLLVAVDHQNGYVTLYGHNSKLLVRVGQSVDSSTCIALSGNTGKSTGPHVHYEIRVWPDQQPLVNPSGIKTAADVNGNLKGMGEGTDE